MSIDRATYSPEDNKIRLYPSGRLDPDTYARVKGAGFIWAPKQEVFVAPAWTPDREDLAEALAGGELEDEDTTLAERAEERSERFEEYSEKRQQDAERASKAVDAIAGGIPLGQPILVGHHSERRARRDAEKIRSGMDKAVRLWKTSKYWQDRARGAIAHARYKELPAVRARRIKGLEADLRKVTRDKEEAEKWLKLWSKEGLNFEQARHLANYCHLGVCKHPTLNQMRSAYDVLKPQEDQYPGCEAWTVEQVVEVAKRAYPAQIARAQRWIDHLTNRIGYERAMLEESGGLTGAKFDYQIGGKVLRRGTWYPVVKVNKRGGEITSVGVTGHFARSIPLDEIKDYQPPEEGAAEIVKAAMDKGPMCNYPGEGFKHYTEAEWKARKRMCGDWPSAQVLPANEKHDRHRVRGCRDVFKAVCVFLTDKPVVNPPAPPAEPPPKLPKATPAMETPRAPRPAEEPTKFDAMAQSLKAGVHVVSAPQLFPTPPEVAAKVVELAQLYDGCRILEPSAGTGNLIRAILSSNIRPESVEAVEIVPSLKDALTSAMFEGVGVGPIKWSVKIGDFLGRRWCELMTDEAQTYDRILMNPPFENASDIEHIEHARKFLRPGGILVSVCAAGPRQRAKYEGAPGVEWHDLPADSFKSSGTSVNTAIVMIRKEWKP